MPSTRPSRSLRRPHPVVEDAAHRAAGEVTLAGPFLAQHRAEVLNIVMACEARARTESAGPRIIDVLEIPGGVRVTTNDADLARTIAVAVHEACQGDLDLRFEKRPTYLRAAWRR